MTLGNRGKPRRCLDKLKETTVQFGLVQIEAGADALAVPDHATSDLVSAQSCREVPLEIHRELAARLPASLILHICWRTIERMEYIAQTGMAAFHFDSKNDLHAMVHVMRNRIALIGNINNPVTLLSQVPAEVRQEAFGAPAAGVQLVGPEYAIPLTTPIENLKEIPSVVQHWHRGKVAGNGTSEA
jgi:[methyl-Co(III) methanol-specific corrinoid protein]:coenzyme M methyltransferase